MGRHRAITYQECINEAVHAPQTVQSKNTQSSYLRYLFDCLVEVAKPPQTPP